MPPTTLKELVNVFLDIINLLIPALFAILFLFITWKIFDAWVINAADEQKREEGKKLALTAVLVIVVMLSVWGIVTMLKSSIFGI
jgi:hypothetical protein